MKQRMQISVVLLALMMLPGCATTVRTTPGAITTPIEKKHNQTIAIVISKKDLERRELVAMGIAGNLFPLKVEVGDFLKRSAEYSFGRLFEKASIGEIDSKDYMVTIEIENFSMLGIDAKAHLELQVTMSNGFGEVVLDKKYAGIGSGHAPVYWSEEAQKLQVSKSTQEAFQFVFNNIAADVIELEIN